LYTKLILIALSSSKYTIIYDNGISIKGGIIEGVGRITDGWFGECVVRKVGDEIDTLFWTDPWLGGIPLCERFSRLLDLAMTKSFTVAMGGWGGGVGVEETFVGVGGGDVGGVSDLTFISGYAG
jgi:hypothetical protein